MMSAAANPPGPALAKFLLLIALVIVVYLLFRGFRRDAGIQDSVRRSSSRDRPVPEDMVRCAVCGVHLPRSESFISKGKFFCTDEHRRLGLQEPGKH
jgi:uncharacterized protein